MPSIADLLAERQVRLLEVTSFDADPNLLLTWQRLWTEFESYMELRDYLTRDGGRRPFIPQSMRTSSLAAHLVNVGLLKGFRGTYCVASATADRLLRGAWLEELGATVARDAGADEVLCSQKLTWKSRHSGDALYHNEIDVLARFEDEIAFISCKALSPWAIERAGGVERVFDAMKEVSYWRLHFGAGRGRAILLTTVILSTRRNIERETVHFLNTPKS